MHGMQAAALRSMEECWAGLHRGTILTLSPPAAALPRLLEELSDDDFCMDDGHHLKPHEVHSYLCRVLYNRRNKCAGGQGGGHCRGDRCRKLRLQS